jgi:U3 small nucleolar RNA-associated protein 4
MLVCCVLQTVLDTVGVPIWQMAIEPLDDAKNTENNSSEFAVNGHTNQNDSSDSDFSNIDDGDNSEDEDGSTNTRSSYHVNDFQRMALACDDGSVRLFNVPDSGALTYYRFLPRVSGMSRINLVFCYFGNKFSSGSNVLVSVQGGLSA